MKTMYQLILRANASHLGLAAAITIFTHLNSQEIFR